MDGAQNSYLSQTDFTQARPRITAKFLLSLSLSLSLSLFLFVMRPVAKIDPSSTWLVCHVKEQEQNLNVTLEDGERV